MKRTQKEKICKECGKRFVPRSPNGKYCCIECSRKAERKQYEIWRREVNEARRPLNACAICGKPFLAGSVNARYCSHECNIIAKKEASLRRHREAMERRKREEEARRRPPLWYKRDGFTWAQVLQCMKENDCQYQKAVEILSRQKGE